jgi:hypothetical protein
MNKFIILDIDNTIADTKLSKIKRDIYDYTKVYDDDLRIDVVNHIRDIYKDCIFIYISGRKDNSREVTAKWLLDKFEKYVGYDSDSIPIDKRLFLRDDKDNRPNFQTKLHLYCNFIKSYSIDKNLVLMVFEDDFDSANAYMDLGLKIYQPIVEVKNEYI